MSLQKQDLELDLEALMSLQPFPASATAAGEKWADIYADYAGGAQSCAGVPATLAAAKETLRAALGAAFASGVDPATTASMMASAFTAFWLAPPVAFVGTSPGVVTAVGGTAVLSAGFVTTWAANVAAQATASQAAAALATLLDVFTKTVVVTHSAPTACVATLT